MRLTHNKKFKVTKSQIKLEFVRTTGVHMLQFDGKLTKEEADKVGEVMVGYEQEKVRLLERLSALHDVQILNSHIAGQPLGIIVPEDDAEKIKEQLS